MKLLLQVLFAQGWLWRDRFPHIYAEAKVERSGTIAYLILLLSFVVLLLMGIFLSPTATSRGASWCRWLARGCFGRCPLVGCERT